MNNTKDIILEKAFVLFLEKGYEGVSISDLQKELGLGRASLYHHFESKKNLFIEVLNKFVAIGEAKHMTDYADLTVSELLSSNIERHKLALAYHNRMTDKKIGMLNYFILALQGAEFYPEFKEKTKELRKRELEQWKTVITNSIKKGEVRKDIKVDETARLFIYAENGIGVKATFNAIPENLIPEMENMYYNLYSLIKA